LLLFSTIQAFMIVSSIQDICAGSLELEIERAPGIFPLGAGSELVLQMTWQEKGDGLLPVLSPFDTKNIRIVDGDITSSADGSSSSLTLTYVLSGIEVGPAEIGPFSAVLVDSSGSAADSVFVPLVEMEIGEAARSRTIFLVIPILVLAMALFAVFMLRQRQKPVEREKSGGENELLRLDKICDPHQSEEFLIRADDFARRFVSGNLEIDASKLTAREIAEELSRKGFGKEQISAAESLFNTLQDTRFSKAESTPEKLGAVLSELKNLVRVFEE
jgi:hypothetical protein